ncbi:uncharacterized protein N7518_009044 [Penicillium psychrosexuale]|uniref:uncharacterized protein n=1 Tax=Penicillium psychrosexuale TaxID=1002107 RepID=UPI00254588E3|nr:uncharacterized protein N7518_009044 [Penicillium psychrosexuale]KAJ5783367.1 hypothetical protein N7518_009044 [Penicillium psychrosexuale]
MRFLRDVVHRISIRLHHICADKLEVKTGSRCLRPSGGNAESRSALLPFAGKTSFSSHCVLLFSSINHPPSFIFSL